MSARRDRLFTRPAPLLAMALLVVNDHLLKGSGLLPGWLTGKLSDFAGLFFAPLLLAELTLLAVPARDGRGVVARVAGCAGLICAVFAAIKLSPAASETYLAVLGPIVAPLGWRLANTVDPGDLMALVSACLALVYARRAACASSAAALPRAPATP